MGKSGTKNDFAGAVGGGEFRLALRTACVFAAAYMLLIFLSMFYLPQNEPWRTIWMAAGMVMGLAAAAAVLLVWLTARRRRSPDLALFRGFFWEMRNPGCILLLAWFVWACVACLLATREGLASIRHNSSYLFDLAVSLLVLFPLGHYFGRRGDLRLLYRISDAAACLFAVMVLFSFRLILSGGGTASFLGREFQYQTYRLSMGTNANTTGAYCAFFLMLALYRIPTIKKPAGKILYGLFAAALVFTLWKSGSRTGVVSTAAGIIIFAAALLIRKLKAQSSVWVCALLIGFAAVFAAVLVLFLVNGTASFPFRAVSSMFAWFYRNSHRPVSSWTMGNRFPLWNAVAAAVRQDRHLLLHGCSPASVIGSVETLTGRPLYTHNQFLEILLGQGLPAVVLFTAWLLWMGRTNYVLFRSRSSRTWILSVLLLTLVIGNLAEAMLTCLQHYVGSVFFLIAGCLNGLAAAGDRTD